MRRLRVAPIAVVTLILLMVAIPIVAADSNTSSVSAHTIKVWPVGTTVDTGKPIVTNTPANLFILHTGQGPIKNVWLLIIINEPTYDNLDMIMINGTQFMSKTDFTQATTSKIPPTAANSSTGYPGTTWQYEIAAIKSNMNETGKVYWAIKYFLPQITTAPTYFTLAVQLTATADIKALILGLGRYDPPNGVEGFSVACDHDFNRFTSFSKGTFVVPEIATLALAASPLAGLGLYAIRRRKK